MGLRIEKKKLISLLLSNESMENRNLRSLGKTKLLPLHENFTMKCFNVETNLSECSCRSKDYDKIDLYCAKIKGKQTLNERFWDGSIKKRLYQGRKVNEVKTVRKILKKLCGVHCLKDFTWPSTKKMLAHSAEHYYNNSKTKMFEVVDYCFYVVA